ncbi:MAG: low molecular weight protein arginine phosphatase [Anaerolineaceae bacterium]|nr:MAG: low molecular weight protein arginine phosphatase [Anaerolineaceae bacterium]
MAKYNKIIFVCTGNTCRSPMGEAIYKSLDKESEVKVSSRGLVVLFGEPINPKAEVVLKKHDLEINNHISKGLKASEIDDNTLILTMTNAHKRKIRDTYPNAKNVYTIKEYAGESGDVVDPYGGSLVEYEECYIELARLVKKTVYKVSEDNHL